jgi:formylglycine-generating enzyme required for sulfatase activity
MSGSDLAFGRYRMIREIGRGGHATVHLAEDAKLGRNVALKVFASGAGSDAREDERRFRREVAALSRLDVPNVCRLLDAGGEEGARYIAMSHVAGRTLEELFAAGKPGRPGLLAVIETAAAALALVHQGGVIHGDLKPGNLMIDGAGACAILDFSLARVESDEAGERAEGGGTLPYMAPEHFTGDAVGCQADVYALGATLHEALTGRPPFSAPTKAGLVAAILANDVAELRAGAHRLGRDLTAITEKCLDRDLRRRYASARDLADDLARLRRGEPVRARRVGPFGRAVRVARRHPAASFLAAFLVLALAAGLVGVETSRREEERLLSAAAGQSDRARDRSAEAAKHLAGFLRLSDVQKVADLERRSARLWPARAAIIPDLEGLLEEARALVRQAPGHEATLAALRAGARHGTRIDLLDDAMLAREIADLERRRQPEADALASTLKAGVPAAAVFEYADAARTFEDQVLGRLVAELSTMQGPDPRTSLIASLERRLALARSLDARPVGDHATAWERAIASIADRGECPAYAGLRLEPQSGIVPLGRDPASGLWEFHHLATGARPRRDAAGRLVPGDDTGLVLVLIPGGRTTLGSRRPGGSVQEGEPFVCPTTRGNEFPPHSVDLAPFFLSKYEMTHGQWLRAALQDPSTVALPRNPNGDLLTLAHPVEEASWREATQRLWRAGLALPTEAQWEHAVRAGTTTPWWTGSDPSTLVGAGNFGDRSYFSAFPTGVRPEDAVDIDDGFICSAPVGRFRANPFGLHDVLGNVSEWCRDAYARYDAVFQEKDGELLGGSVAQRVFRGGASMHTAAWYRSAHRVHDAPDQVGSIGVRPARAID